MLCSVATAEVALVAATPKTVLGLKMPANRKAKLTAWGIYFDGISAVEAPVVIDLHRDTNVTGHTATGLTEVHYDVEETETIVCVAGHTVTANTTSGGVLQSIECHPQGGYEKAYMPGREIRIGGTAISGLYWVVTAPAACNCIMFAEWDE